MGDEDPQTCLEAYSLGGQVPGFLKIHEISQGGGGRRPGRGVRSHHSGGTVGKSLLLGTQGGSQRGGQLEWFGPGLQGGSSAPAPKDLRLRLCESALGTKERIALPTAVLGRVGQGRAGRLEGFPLTQPQGVWGEDGGGRGWLAGRSGLTGSSPSIRANYKPKKTQVKHLRALLLSLKPHTQHPGPSCREGLQRVSGTDWLPLQGTGVGRPALCPGTASPVLPRIPGRLCG